MRVFLMLASGLVAGEFHPQFRGNTLICQRACEAVAQGVKRAFGLLPDGIRSGLNPLPGLSGRRWLPSRNRIKTQIINEM